MSSSQGLPVQRPWRPSHRRTAETPKENKPIGNKSCSLTNNLLPSRKDWIFSPKEVCSYTCTYITDVFWCSSSTGLPRFKPGWHQLTWQLQWHVDEPHLLVGSPPIQCHFPFPFLFSKSHDHNQNSATHSSAILQYSKYLVQQDKDIRYYTNCKGQKLQEPGNIKKFHWGQINWKNCR